MDGFENLVHTFWFHAIWSEKKLLRGEIWAAKNWEYAYPIRAEQYAFEEVKRLAI